MTKITLEKRVISDDDLTEVLYDCVSECPLCGNEIYESALLLDHPGSVPKVRIPIICTTEDGALFLAHDDCYEQFVV